MLGVYFSDQVKYHVKTHISILILLLPPEIKIT